MPERMSDRPISAVIEQCVRDGTPIEYDPWGDAIMVMDGPHRGRGIDVDAMLSAYRAEVARLRARAPYVGAPGFCPECGQPDP